MTSYKISPALFLVAATIAATAPAKPVEVKTNHIVAIDCSGSMYGELSGIRAQLKKKLPKLLKEGDTLSLIWFSGRGEVGTLLEGEPVATLSDLKVVEAAIDRWLRPVGMTGFKDPMEEVSRVVDRLGKKTPGAVFSLFFMTDGYNNSWTRAEVLAAVKAASGGLASATFVEYGYYGDRPLLSAMAETAGGTHIHAKDFDAFFPAFEAAMQKRPMGGKRVDFKVDGDPVGGMVWTQDGGDLTTFGLTGNSVSVPENTSTIYYLSPKAVGAVETLKVPDQAGPVYAAISLFSVRLMPDVVLPLLKTTGDVTFIKQFGGLFGRQKYTAFMEAAKAATFDPAKRLTEGYNPDALPRDDAFTVLDMLKLVAGDDGNRVLLDHKAFKYSAISRARVDASTVLTPEEQTEVDRLSAEMAKAGKNAKKIAELAAEIAKITTKPEALKFEAKDAPDGYEVNNLVYNKENPNISIQVTKPGTVDITKRRPEALKTVLPDVMQTKIVRNYAIVKDGLINVASLPVKLSPATMATLFAAAKNGLLADDVVTTHTDGTLLLALDKLPVINRNMVKTLSAKALFLAEWDLLKVQAEQKVYKTVLKEQFGGTKSATFEQSYGADGALWLKEQGFADYGFGPKSVQAESTDFYMARELSVSVKGYSAIPSLNDFNKQAAKGKFTASAMLMKPAVDAIEKYKASDAYKTDGDAGLEKWLRGEEKRLDLVRRAKIAEKAQAVFVTIVGGVWFQEFASLDETSLSLDVGGTKLDCSVQAKEVKVQI